PIAGPQIAQIVVATIVANNDLVLDCRNTRRRPGHSFRLFKLGPGSHGALEKDLAALCFNGDAICVQLRVSQDRLFDLALGVSWFSPRRYSDHVADAVGSC